MLFPQLNDPAVRDGLFPERHKILICRVNQVFISDERGILYVWPGKPNSKLIAHLASLQTHARVSTSTREPQKVAITQQETGERLRDLSAADTRVKLDLAGLSTTSP